MKKFLLIVMLLVAGVTQLRAEDTIVDVTQCYNGQVIEICHNRFDRVLVQIPEGCNSYHFWVHNQEHTENPVILDSNENNIFICEFIGCGITPAINFGFAFIEPNVPNETTAELWKHQGYPIPLESIGADSLEMYDFHWSTGETTPTIEVTEPGIYTCSISDQCATAIRTFIVRDNVELYRATCDLRSNLNQVTWLTTPEQAEYIREVKVYRNTYQLVATVPYLDGSFTDNIGSESTQWQYHIVGVDNEGNECPIPSYWKRTIHLDHVQGTGGGEILQWTPYEEENPAKNTVIYYSIYDVVDGEPQHVMDVGNFTNVYAYNPADFDGYGTVAAVFEGKGRDMEDLAFSNLTAEILDVGEVSSTNFSVYPNPTNGTFTVEGTTDLTVFNTLGQAVATSHSETGTHTFTLRSGIYFVKSDEGSVQKVVVE